MTRFRSLGVSDFDVRQQLRNRFEHALGTSPWQGMHLNTDSELDDITGLNLLLNTRVASNAQRQRFEVRYEQARAQAAELPDLAEAMARGWFRVVDGQFVVSQAVRDYVRHAHPPFETALIELAQWSWLLRFTVGAGQLQGESATLAAQLQALDSDNLVIPVRSPAWVVARLWDGEQQPDLWEWTVKWRLLGAPDFRPGQVWTAPVEAAFAKMAIDAASTAGLETWQDFLAVERMQRLWESGDARAQVVEEAKAPPAHFLGKLVAVRRPVFKLEEGQSASLVALRLTVLNLARRERGPLPHPELAPLIRLAGTHPGVLELIEGASRQEPRLLADLLMHPKTAMAAAYLIATWPPRARNEVEEEAAERELRMTAFADAVRAVDDHVNASDADPAEFAELLTLLQAHRHNAGALQEPWARRVEQTVTVLKRAAPDFQLAVLGFLGERGQQGAGTPAFAILLEALGSVTPEVATGFSPMLLAAYREAIASDADVGDLESLAPQSAHTLVEALLGLGAEGLQTLRAPVHVAETLAATTDEASKSQATFRLAYSVRAHIRILARAATVYGEVAPPELVDALERVIGMGALAHAEKGKVAAFSGSADSVRMWGRRQRSMADEMAQAVNRLATPNRRKVVDALLKMDEPGVLAELCQHLPSAFRADIERRVEQLVPQDAGHISTITELQRTIQQLLGAGLTQAAERFMAFEESVSTGPAPSRDVERFRARLLAMLLKKQYSDILNSKLPDALSPQDAAAAQDVLEMHHGLIHLEAGTHKDPVKAQAIFHRLHSKHPGVKAYAINLLAARVDLVLPTDTFAKATGDAIGRARHALEDAASMVQPGSLLGEQQAIHSTNVAVLQLCLGLTGEALATLRAIDPARALPASVAVEAVARAREGLPEQALLVLKHAELRYGKHEALDGATSHIRDGAAYIATAGRAATEMTVETFRESFGRFKAASPLVQAQVHAEGTGVPPLEALLTNVVRDALASLGNLVPVLRLHDDQYDEDAINTMMRETLRVQLSPWYGWTVADQSRGGPTASGGVGERDIVIAQHNTEIAVIEAMKFSTSGKRGVASHLKKVAAYSSCTVFFHVVYSHEIKPDTVLSAVTNIAATQTGSLRLQSQAPLPPVGNQPPGLVARYEDAGGRRVAIVFLVADLQQHGQRVAIGASTASPLPVAAAAVTLAAATPAPSTP